MPRCRLLFILVPSVRSAGVHTLYFTIYKCVNIFSPVNAEFLFPSAVKVGEPKNTELALSFCTFMTALLTKRTLESYIQLY